MDPLTLSLIGGAASTVIGLIGRAIAEGDYATARQLREQMVAEYGDDNLPVIDRLVAQEVGPSAFNAIKGDDALRGDQMRALDELRNVYDTEGMTDADKAAMRLAQNEVAGHAAAGYANNQQRLARMGQTGNAALSSALSANTGAAATGAIGDLAAKNQIAARDRALRALEAEAGLAGDVRAQDFGEASAKARANDAVATFNATQRTDTANRNNANAFAQFDARMGLKGARNAARAGQVNAAEQSAARTQQTVAGIGKGVSEGFSAAAGYGQREQDIAREDDWRKRRGY